MELHEHEIRRRLAANVAAACERIARAAEGSGRTAREITLVGVSKYVAAPFARLLVAAGVTHLGESRPQELWKKSADLSDLAVSWHLIGHLQRNKVKKTVPLTTLIHSVDNLSLLQDIHAAQVDQPPRQVLLEVNISGDESKHGLQPAAVEPLFPEIHKLSGIAVLGLMTMASLEGGPTRARRDFAALRELAESLKPHCAHNIQMNELSMGMSGDYEIAIEEGATIVRIGSALFAGIAPPN